MGIEIIILLAHIFGNNINEFAQEYQHYQMQSQIRQVQMWQQELMIDRYSDNVEILEAIKKIEK